jgi:hypothetical protein
MIRRILIALAILAGALSYVQKIDVSGRPLQTERSRDYQALHDRIVLDLDPMKESFSGEIYGYPLCGPVRGPGRAREDGRRVARPVLPGRVSDEGASRRQAGGVLGPEADPLNPARLRPSPRGGRVEGGR